MTPVMLLVFMAGFMVGILVALAIGFVVDKLDQDRLTADEVELLALKVYSQMKKEQEK